MSDISKLRAALEVLRVPNPAGSDKRSWTRGRLHGTYQGADRYCMLGALQHVGACYDWKDTSVGDSFARDQRAIVRVANEHFPIEERAWCDVASFNDFKDRTFSDIEIVLEKAAVLREEEGAKTDWTMPKDRPAFK